MSACTLQNPHLKPPLAPVVHSVPLSVLINACVGANQEWPPFLMPDIFNVRCRQCLRIKAACVRVDHVEWPPFPVAILPINRALPTCLRPGIYQQFPLWQQPHSSACFGFTWNRQHCNAKSRPGHLMTQPGLTSPLHCPRRLHGISSVPKLLMKGVCVCVFLCINW